MQIEMDKLMELGAKLKEKRRALGLEREEVAIKIKVSAKTLHALEEAIPDSLPQPVFAKGFARSYADFLGMNAPEIGALIADAFPMTPIDNINPELSAAAREQSITINQTSNTKLMAIVVPVLLIVLGLAGWFVFKTFFTGDNTPPVQVRQEPASLPGGLRLQPLPVTEEQPPAAESADAAAQSVEPGSEAQPAAAPAQPANPAAQQPEAARPALNLPPNQVPQSNARGDSPIPGGQHRVVLFAKYECWVGAEFDDIGRRSFTLEAGQTFVLDFRQKLTLTLGNSGAIDMSYDGQPFDTGGRFREAKVLNFPPR